MGGLNMHSITGTDAISGNKMAAADYAGFGYNIVMGIVKPNDIAGKTTSKVTMGGSTYEDETKLKDYGTDFRRADILLTPGITFWFGQIGIDVTWQRGLIPMSADTDIKVSNILFRLAYKF